MREIYRHSDYATVVYYRNLLEQHGIKTQLRNEIINSIEPNIPVFFPNICIFEDDQYNEAHQLLKKWIDERENRVVGEIVCPNCGEVNPDSFEFCFSCEVDIPAPQ